jgi:hypothetical protein
MRRELRVAVRRDYEGRARPRIDLRREWKEMVFVHFSLALCACIPQQTVR